MGYLGLLHLASCASVPSLCALPAEPFVLPVIILPAFLSNL